MDSNKEKVTMVAETQGYANVHTGDCLKLTIEHGKYQLVNERGRTVSEDLSVNVSPESAAHLAFNNAKFIIAKTEGNVFKAYISDSFTAIQPKQTEWNALN